jgi:ribosomal protein S12 methylthiotransferase
MSLANEGAGEICLVAQDLTAYGRDLGYSDGLTRLIDALETSLPYDMWLRLLYLQPAGVDRSLLERVAAGRQVLPYLDIPIQHASSKILGAMNRTTSPEQLMDIFMTARDIRADFALRTTCMVGFPGESRADFTELLRFLDKVRFDRVGAFTYSPEEGTPAADFSPQVSTRTKRSRAERLMSLQDEISLERQTAFVGRDLEVLIDSCPEEGTAEGRSFREAPEVDGLIEIRTARKNLRVGEKIMVRITGAYEHDMLAEEVAP